VRFRGGTCRRLSVPLPKLSWQMRQTPSQIVAEIDELLDQHCEEAIAGILNQRRRVSGEGKPFHRTTVLRIHRSYGLKKRYDRLRDAGLLTLSEVAEILKGLALHGEEMARERFIARSRVQRQKGMPVRATGRRSTDEKAGPNTRRKTTLPGGRVEPYV
jgi:hypothetical protein